SCSLGRTDFPKGGSWASPLARRLATASGRIEFVSCGLVVRLQLLPTLPRGNAVTFDYEPEHRLEENFHLLDFTHSPSHWPPALPAVERTVKVPRCAGTKRRDLLPI
ncbi:MAG: hypothetical protein M0Z50_06350, partial [Planctomycetia bacterium]|nr:hypothetical protein [Planctomycetia bacterium]